MISTGLGSEGDGHRPVLGLSPEPPLSPSLVSLDAARFIIGALVELFWESSKTRCRVSATVGLVKVKTLWYCDSG